MSRKIIIFLIIIALFLFFQNAFAYDDKTTHPALTDEIIDFYNLSFPDNQLTPQQKEWIIEGSILEDTPPRWINHFYDPVYKIGWSGENTGIYDKETVQLVSEKLIAPYGITPVSSLEWMHNKILQAQYAFYKSDKTWERGILEMIKGNEEDAYKILGYILHLIEDSSVPEHTRNDTHAHELEGVTGDYGSPYEEYLKKYTRQNLDIASGFYKQGSKLIERSTIDEYLISIAGYSNKYFFSKDTINDPKYQYPKIIREDENFGYGADEKGKEFPLVKITGDKDKKYAIDMGDTYILNAYFSRLSRQAVLNGAGVINLFFEEAESKKEYPSRLVIYDFSIFNYFVIPKVSIAGETIRVKNVAQAFAGQINSAVSGAFSFVGNLFSGVAGNNKNSQQANIQQVIKNSENKILDNKNIQENSYGQNFQILDEPINFATKQNNGDIIKNAENLPIDANPKLSPDFQDELNDIENKANDLNNQVKLLASQQSNNTNSSNYYITYFGGGGGGGGASAPTSAAATSETSENIILNTNQEIATSTPESAASTISTATSSQETAVLDSIATTTIITTTTTIIATSTALVSNIVISEILFDAEENDKGKEFIELYNLTDDDIDLNDWSLKYFRENSTSTKSLAVFGSKPEDKVLIPANGFLLIGLNDYDALNYNNVVADILRKESLPNGSEETIVILYDEKDNEIDRIIYDKNLTNEEGQSLERLASQDNKCVSSQDEGELLGNGCDNGETSDFLARITPNPQNSSSLPEPRDDSTTPQDFDNTSSTTAQILLSQLSEASSSINYPWLYQEFGNGISGRLESLEINMSTGDACQYFYFQEFNDAGYSQLSREFTSRISNDNLTSDFVVKFMDGSLWNFGTCDNRGGGKITLEFNGDIEANPEKYYRLYFVTGDVSRTSSFIGSDFDTGFGNFKGCVQKSDVGNGIVYRWQECFTPDFDIYFVLKGMVSDANSPI